MDAPLLDIPYARQPFPGILTAGQPDMEQLRAAKDAGYKTIINTRGHGEPGVAAAAQVVTGLGMRYLHIPMSGPQDVNLDNARLLADALAREDALPALVHCGSSNRVGALFALKAFHLEGTSAAEAMAQGRAAGLAGLAGYVQMLLR